MGGGGGMGSLRANYLLPCYCIRNSLLFDMQNNLVLKILNFDLLTPPPKSTKGAETHAFDQKSRLICFIFILYLSRHAKSQQNILTAN